MSALEDTGEWTAVARRCSLRHEDLVPHKSLLRLWLEPLARHPILFWLLIVAVPLVLLDGAVGREGRLALGSVTRTIEVDREVIAELTDLPSSNGGWFGHGASPGEATTEAELVGMSFLGDSMVWPFVFFVPALFHFLLLVIQRTERFVNRVPGAILGKWLERPENGERYREIFEAATRIMCARGPWRWVPRIGIATGLALFAFNLIACTFWQDRTYSAREVCLRPVPQKTAAPAPALADETDCTFVTLDRKVTIPKWDADLQAAPLSWWASRVWVLFFGYFWISIAGARLLLLVIGTGRYVGDLAAEEEALRIDPLSPGRGDSFADLTRLSAAFVYPLVVAALMLAMPFLKEGIDIGWHNWLLLGASVPLLIFTFVYPQWGLSQALERAKTRALRRYSNLFSEVNEKVLEAAADPASPADLGKLRAGLEAIKENYRRVEGISRWPFERSAFFRVLSASLTPFVIPLVKNLLQRLGWLG